MNTTATNPPTWKKDVGIRATNDSALYYHIQRKGSSLPLECMNRSTEVIPPIRNTGMLLTEKGIPHSVEPVITGEQKQHQSRGKEVLHDGMSYTGVLLVAALDRLQEDPLEKSNGDRSGEESHNVYRM